MAAVMLASSSYLSFPPPESLRPSAVNCRRPAVILPGLGNNSSDYERLAYSLENKYGIPTIIVRVSRIDWLRNAAGLLDSNYWKGTLRPRPVLDWYLKRIDSAINEAKHLSRGGSLSLIGHSAGGWLARVYMEDYGKSGISLLLTLGTPHLPPRKDVAGVIDQTRGLLDYVQNYCSQAVYTPQLKYVCISGRYILGTRFFGTTKLKNPNTVVPIDSFQQIMNTEENISIGTLPSLFTNLRACLVGLVYKQVCGQEEVWGDGVVPEMSAHLEGARNISLDRVYHSPVGSDDVIRPWYGSPAALDQWVHHLVG